MAQLESLDILLVADHNADSTKQLAQCQSGARHHGA
jgi:hypothetical protein